MPAPAFSTIQLVSAAVAYAVFEWFGLREGIVFAWSVGFSHYLLGLIYSRAQIGKVVTNSSAILPLILLGLGGAALFYGNFSLYLLFGLHHALNEAYFSTRYRNLSLRPRTQSRLQLLGFISHLSGYLLIVYPASWMTSTWLAGITLGFFIPCITAYFYLIYKGSRDTGAGALLNAVFAEVLLVAVLVIDALWYAVNLYQIVLYHFVFWAIFPAFNMVLRRARTGLLIYLGLTVATLTIFVAGSPIVTGSWLSGYYTYKYWFVVLSFVHISLSVAISSANPLWIRRIFGMENSTPGTTLKPV